MKLIVSKTKSKLTSVTIALQAGSANEVSGGFPLGTAHFLEHFLFKGTEKRGQFDISRGMAFLGADINAYTGHDSVKYVFSAPTENLEQCLEIFCDMVRNPCFPESEFEKEKQVIFEELASSEDDQFSLFYEKMFGEFYTSFYNTPVLGTRESLASIKLDDIKRFYHTFYKPENMIFSVVTSKKESEVQELVNKYFYEVDDKFDRILEYTSKSNIKKSREAVILRKEQEQSICGLCYVSPSKKSKDYYDAYVLSKILGSGMDSRLFQSVREDKNLVYTIQSSTMCDPSSGMFNIVFMTRSPEEAKAVVFQEIDKLLADGVTDEELQRAKNKIKSSLYYSFERQSHIASEKLNSLLENVRFGNLNSIIKKLDKLTKEDILKVAKKIFKGKSLSVTLKQEE